MAENRITQYPAEVLENADGSAVVTQYPVEVLEKANTPVILTQYVVEVLYNRGAGYSYSQIIG